MKLIDVIRFSLIAAGLASAGWTQTQVDLRTQVKSIDFSAALYTLPSQTGPILPSNCEVGMTFILTTSIAGQNWYICTSTNQWTLQGNTLPSVTGKSGMVLSNDGTSLLWNGLGGDVSGALSSLTVNKLQGRPVNSAAPVTGQLLGWNGTQWTPQTLNITIPVTSIFGRTGSITAQTGDYNFAQLAGTVSISQLPSAGGDISGTLSSATVTRLQSRSVANTAPTAGQVLSWNGTQWAPATVSAGGSGGVASIFGRTGAVASQSGDYTAAQVTNAADKTQANSYTVGARQTFTSGISGAGLQVSPGPLPNAPLVGDMVVDSGDTNKFKVYNGTSWVGINTSTLPPGNYTAFFTSATSVSVPGSTHNLGTSNLLVQCFDSASPSNLVEPSQVTVDPASFTVTVTFAAATTGRCTLNGYNGASSTSVTNPGAGMASQLGDLAVVWTSPTTLAIGGNCSVTTPCNVRFGTQTFPVTAAASVSLATGTGQAFVYVDATGTLTVGSTMSLTCNLTCVVAPGITSFPINVIPIYTWTATNNAWDSSGGVDRRGWLTANPIFGGSGIAAVSTAGATTIAIDSAVVPTYLTASASLTFPQISAGTCASDLTFSLPGANPGDSVAPGWPAALAPGLGGTMRISTAGVVSVRLCADATGSVTPAAATYTATVLRSF